jgi:hypothetical protein
VGPGGERDEQRLLDGPEPDLALVRHQAGQTTGNSG